MPNTLIDVFDNICLSSIQGHLSTHPNKGRLSRGRQHIACYVVWAALLSAVTLRTLYIFYFPNVIELVQQIIHFVMRTELKASYHMVIIVHFFVSFIFQNSVCNAYRTERLVPNGSTRIYIIYMCVCIYIYIYINEYISYIYIYIYICVCVCVCVCV